MKLWIARNQDGSLWLHEEKPSLVYDDELKNWYYEWKCKAKIEYADGFQLLYICTKCGKMKKVWL